jgi:hypothetical protein
MFQVLVLLGHRHSGGFELSYLIPVGRKKTSPIQPVKGYKEHMEKDSSSVWRHDRDGFVQNKTEDVCSNYLGLAKLREGELYCILCFLSFYANVLK